MRAETQKSKRSLALRFTFTLLSFLLFGGAAAQAATYTVTNTSDFGVGSVREAVITANSTADDDVIVFDASVFGSPRTIVLFNGALLIANNGSLTINGTGADRLTIDGADTRRVFTVQPGANVTINNLTVTRGRANVSMPQVGTFGGGIYNDAATLTLNRVAVRENVASGRGGGIFNTGTLTINSSTISGNTAANLGGGIANQLTGTLTLINSTVSGNVAGAGGGIFNNTSGAANFSSATIAFNTANAATGGGVAADTVVNADNSIVARNSAVGGSPDVNGTLNSGGYNLIGNTSGAIITGNTSGNILNQNPQLDVLKDNGGGLQTHALLSNSPAIDKGNTALTVDERGFSRPFDIASIPNQANGTDIGAFELRQAPTAASVTIGGRVTTPDGRGLRNALVALTDQGGETRTTLTGAFGYYRFADVGAGETYLVAVTSKRYQFAPLVLNVTEEMKNVNFSPLP